MKHITICSTLFPIPIQHNLDVKVFLKGQIQLNTNGNLLELYEEPVEVFNQIFKPFGNPN